MKYLCRALHMKCVLVTPVGSHSFKLCLDLKNSVTAQTREYLCRLFAVPFVRSFCHSSTNDSHSPSVQSV